VVRPFLAFFAVISLVLPHRPALAQAASEESQAAATAYRQALARYAAGDLEGALASMRESHRLSQRAELLYNIARLESELGNCPASLADYRRYVLEVPQGRYRSDADQATRLLEQQCPDAAPEPKPAGAPVAAEPRVEPPPPPSGAQVVDQPKHSAAEPAKAAPQTYWTTHRWIGWSLVAAGTVAGVGAVYFTTQAIDARDAFQTNVDAAIAGGRLDRSLEDRQHRDQNWSYALYAAGGALLASGVVMLVLAPAQPSRATTTASVHFEPGFLGARISQSF
jgi:hypothetical protein